MVYPLNNWRVIFIHVFIYLTLVIKRTKLCFVRYCEKKNAKILRDIARHLEKCCFTCSIALLFQRQFCIGSGRPSLSQPSPSPD